ncbi:MAG: DNA gyrase inhibitor YacG [Betaproteobacteria bacterium]
MASNRAVSCPRCGIQVAWSPKNRYRPFCGERCKLIDLGQWATEAYRVPQAESPDPGEENPDGSG